MRDTKGHKRTIPERSTSSCEDSLERLKSFVRKNDLRNAGMTYVKLLQMLDAEQAYLEGKTGYDKTINRLHQIREEANIISDQCFPWTKKRIKTEEQENPVKAKSSQYLGLPVEIHLVDHCNLSCRSCAHYSCIAEKRYITMEELTDALQYASKMHPSKLNILGGEPLLHPQIDEIVARIGELIDSDIEVHIVTNGILINKMTETFWENLCRFRIRLVISEYSLDLDYSKLIKTAKMKGVEAVLRKGRNGYFVETLLSPGGEKDPGKVFASCRTKCLQICDNKLFPCPYSAYIKTLNKTFRTSFRHEKNDYLILDDSITTERVKAWMMQEKSFCRYCNAGEERMIPWESLPEHKKSEWIKESNRNERCVYEE